MSYESVIYMLRDALVAFESGEAEKALGLLNRAHMLAQCQRTTALHSCASHQQEVVAPAAKSE